MTTRRAATTVRRRTWRVSHVVTACLGLAAIFAVGFYVASITLNRATLSGSLGPPGPRNASEAGLRHANIWLAPDPNNQCRLLTFDNLAGSIRDQGRMHCNDTFSQPGAGGAHEGLSGVHVQSVREGFVRR